MSSLSAKDRVSWCSFTFSDGRRCRTPRTGKNPRFCFYHAQKEARARAVQKLGKDLAYFFSGDYLSACDLSTALACLIPAVVRGDVKPKTAHTVAYLAQTLMQAIHLSKHEYINAFGTDAWRHSVRTSVNGNRDYLFPPDPRSGGLQAGAPPPEHTGHPLPAQRQTQPPQPAPSPHTPMPSTSTEFVQHVAAALQTGSLPAPPPNSPLPARPSTPPKPTPSPPPAPSPPTMRAKQGRPRTPLRPQLPSPHRRQTLLESTLTHPPATVDSKPLIAKLSPLSATLTKKLGGVGPLWLTRPLWSAAACCRFSPSGRSLSAFASC